MAMASFIVIVSLYIVEHLLVHHYVYLNRRQLLLSVAEPTIIL